MGNFPTLVLKRIECRVLPMRTRFPFRYGIASLTALPHLVLQAEVEVDGQRATGLASEGLPPKWFTKKVDTSFEQDLPAMLAVIQKAIEAALASPAGSFFSHWRNLHDEQMAWASSEDHPPLLANLGVSLVERVLLDALCRHLQRPVDEVIRENLIDLRLGDVRADLAGLALADILPGKPAATIIARHTIGLGDPLTLADVTDETRVDDGLPLDLESCIRSHGLTHFKIKVCGDLSVDLPRLRTLAELMGPQARFTLDGNEQYVDIAAFREDWEAWREDRIVRECLDAGLLLVEQPAHRGQTLADSVAEDLAAWPERPSLIIDEADGDLDSLPAALALGYDGCSHKNCKGIVKGIANAATLARVDHDRPVHLTGDDLANVGPIALLQDLAMMATLGIAHVERNGHHYFRGLCAWPEAVCEASLAAHGDLYREHPDGYPTLRIEAGRLHLASVLAAPFGLQPCLDVTALAEVDLSDLPGFLVAGMPTA